MTPHLPLIFGIGLPQSGGRWLEAWFQGNGDVWHHHRGGKLAVDLAWAKATGAAALASWPRAAGFSGLYRLDKPHLPGIAVGDLIPWLARTYPDAQFIDTARDIDDWIAARWHAEDGQHRADCARRAGVTEPQLPEVWRAERAAHDALCDRVFGPDKRFVRINIDADPIETISKLMGTDAPRKAAKTLPDLVVPAPMPDIDQPAASKSAPTADMSFTSQIIDFAIQTEGRDGPATSLSKIAVQWHAKHRFLDRKGKPADIIRADDAVLIGPKSGLERAQGTLSDLIAHGAKPPLHIDMMDARQLGTPGHRAAPRRTVVYNRRPGVANLTLWPLPGYHSLGPRGAPGAFPVDGIQWGDKVDRCVWLGNITGRMSPVLTPEGHDLRGVYAIRADMNGDTPEWDKLIAELSCVPRYRLVKTFRDHPDFVVGLVLRDTWRALAKTPAFDGLAVPKRDRAFFHRFRYILSLAGNDTGSNFLPAAASGSLILKEEDGWELFYTDAFKPWEHYVPLEQGAIDVEEKLAWARAHPDRAQAMAKAATRMYDRFADPANRKAILRGIAERLNTLD